MVLENALYWLEEFELDGLRLDAVHAICDPPDKPFLPELTRAVKRLGRAVLFAEDERNDPSLVTTTGFDAIWADDFHHAVHVTLTGERDGYYAGYEPGARTIADAITRGWLYEGAVYPAWGKRRGKPTDSLPAEALLYCIQNHDQVGNRALGDRLGASVSTEAYGAVSMLLLFLPMTVLLFMGQEWNASTPFLFFSDHEAELGKSVVRGRRSEFAKFAAFSDPAKREQIPNPQALATFTSSKLRWEEREEPAHADVAKLYRAMLHLRSSDPVLQHASRRDLQATARGEALLVRRSLGDEVRLLCVNFGATPVQLERLDVSRGVLRPVLAFPPDSPDGWIPAHGAVLLAGAVSGTKLASNRSHGRA
jgi:maltooligosyltrehalose trehalohydrolase